MAGIDIDDIPNYPCPICRTYCHPLTGVFVDGRWYHERCYIQYIGEEVSKLQKKVKRGNITLEEAEELRSLEPTYKKMRAPKKDMDIRTYRESPKFQGNTKIALISASLSKPKQPKKLLGEKETNKLLKSPSSE